MLESEQIDKLRTMLAGSGWRDVVKPILEARKNAIQNLAFLLPSERPEPYSKLDDHTATSLLKGEAKSLEWVINVFQNEVVVYDANRLRQETLNGTETGANRAQLPIP